MYYFGTSIHSAGHYLHEVVNGRFREVYHARDTPFHPESVTDYMPNGAVNWVHSKSIHGDITMCAIAGSCTDDRPNSKSVFWVKEHIPFEELKQRILSTPCCKEIIDKIKFQIKW